MALQWYYGRGSDISGPVSDAQLSTLVASGDVLRSDTLWQDDVEDGVAAGTVQNFFALEPVPIPAAPMPKPLTTARATAGKGVIIVGQDGKTVKFRVKCTVCGLEDASWKTIPIPRGVARASFFCRKCRKTREGEVNGFR